MLRARGLHPRRSQGQHFLVDENILNKIIQAAALKKEDTVIDIGAGPGALSLAMSKQVAAVIAIEQDRGLAAFLREQKALRGLSNMTVIEGDVRRLDLASLWDGGQTQEDGAALPVEAEIKKQVKVVANLPYYLTTPLLFKLLQGRDRPALLVLMVQFEVARRILPTRAARIMAPFPCSVNIIVKANLLFKVSRHVFYPRPEVDSAVIMLETLPQPSVSVPDEALFWEIVRGAFQQRRKTILNALIGVGEAGREEWEQMLGQAGIISTRRGETLTLPEFAKLAEILYNR
jgi:16S rRNA (adenine1518-N6/adenine1519-N6)-dimethyltransferase